MIKITNPERLIDKYSEDIDIAVDGGSSHEIISVIDTSRKFTLYGKPAGKISIFIRDNNLRYLAMETGKEGYETITRQYREIDYCYALNGSKWMNIESSMFSTMESHDPGAKAFNAVGIH